MTYRDVHETKGIRVRFQAYRPYATSMMSQLLIPLKRSGMPAIGDIGFDPISRYDFIQFRTPVDVELHFLSILISDPIIFAIHAHQRPFDRIFGQALSNGWCGLFARHRIGSLTDPHSNTENDHCEY